MSRELVQGAAETWMLQATVLACSLMPLGCFDFMLV